MSFEARQSTVGKLLNDAIYRIPRNQRMYVWNERNWGDLYQDINLVKKGVASTHFIGSIVLMEEADEDGLSVYTIIDGQQRIITLAILLASILYAFKRRGLSEDAGGTKKYLIATDIKNNSHAIVAPDNHLTLMRLTDGVIGVSEKEAASTSPLTFARARCVSKAKDDLIVKAFHYFSTRLDAMDDGNLIAYRDAVIATTYVNISSSTEEDSYTIFEILNARGLALEDHELLKNYIMRYVNPAEKRDDAKQVWSEIEQTLGSNMKPFLRHYAIHRYRLGPGDKEGPYKKIRDYADPERTIDLLYDLKKKAEYYQEIVSSRDSIGDANVLAFLRAHKVQVFRPLLMSLMHCRDEERITPDEYSNALKFIHDFYICYKIVGGMESNHLTDSIAKHSFALETSFSPSSIKDWKESFQKKLPTIESFEASLKSLGWSHHWALYDDEKLKDRCKLVLELLEHSVGGPEGMDSYTIEHVFPDSVDQRNARIGNLLPLERGLNERCKDKAFDEKLEIYKESRFVSVRKFVQRYEGASFDADVRAKFMAKEIYGQFDL